MKIALAQINPTVGDFTGNLWLIVQASQQAQARGAQLVCFPELAVCGYPPKDLLEREDFVSANLRTVEQLAGQVALPAIVGFVDRNEQRIGRRIYNAAAVLQGGRIVSVHHKTLLPTYDVFDESRHFEPAQSVKVAQICGKRVALTICEDAWNDQMFWPQQLYQRDPVAELAQMGVDFIVNISASPFTLEKRGLRGRMLAAHARKHERPLVFVNQVGGQDDLVFDGHSLAFDATGEEIACGAELEDDLVLVDLAEKTGDVRALATSDDEAAYRALVLGTRDYARRCGFQNAVLGLSGGIDSSLVACIAADAMGKEQILGVGLPTRYSSTGSLRDAEALANALGIRFRVIAIDPVFQAFLDALKPTFESLAPRTVDDVTEQNLQARIRGTTLMGLCNKLGALLLTTGNKSEVAVGYTTLYGDMNGGLAVISDVPKMLVYRLAKYVNREREIIPRAVFEKPPSAELRPNQTDQDTLPAYPLLDRMLEAHVERGLDVAGLVDAGFDESVASDIVARSYRSEYKRWQMPPGIKITGKSFGSGRRMPIAHAWKGE